MIEKKDYYDPHDAQKACSKMEICGGIVEEGETVRLPGGYHSYETVYRLYSGHKVYENQRKTDQTTYLKKNWQSCSYNTLEKWLNS